jgi:hypothetical protein
MCLYGRTPSALPQYIGPRATPLASVCCPTSQRILTWPSRGLTAQTATRRYKRPRPWDYSCRGRKQPHSPHALTQSLPHPFIPPTYHNVRQQSTRPCSCGVHARAPLQSRALDHKSGARYAHVSLQLGGRGACELPEHEPTRRSRIRCRRLTRV